MLGHNWGEVHSLKGTLKVYSSPLSVCRSVSHFMVVTESEFLLVDPDKSKIGWGVVHFISFLQVN